MPVEVVVAPQPEIDGNLQLPQPSYDEVMASLSVTELDVLPCYVLNLFLTVLCYLWY